MKEIVFLQICPTEVIVTPKSTTVRMVSDFPGDKAFLEVAREVFHAGEMDDLSVVQFIDRHPGNLLYRPRRVLGWEAKWNKGGDVPAYPNPGWSEN